MPHTQLPASTQAYADFRYGFYTNPYPQGTPKYQEYHAMMAQLREDADETHETDQRDSAEI
jgi:hypothetical protein